MHDVNYCSDPKDVHVFPFVAESLQKLKARGFKLIMTTNQSGIGRGYFTREQYERVHAEVLRQLGEPLIDATYVCPDVPGSDSKCRKPAPGMITTFLLICHPEPGRLRQSGSDRGTSRIRCWRRKLAWTVQKYKRGPSLRSGGRASAIMPVQTSSE